MIEIGDILKKKGVEDMPVPPEVLKRLDDMDIRLNKLEEAVKDQKIADVRFEEQFKAMQQEFSNLRVDVLVTIREHSSQTWKLINKGIKVIIVLVVFILVFAGAKLSGDILSVI